MLRRQVLAKPPGDDPEPKQFEPGVDPVRDRENLARQIGEPAAQLGDMSPHLAGCAARQLAQAVKAHRQRHHPLTEILVELSGDPGALLLVCLHQPSAQAGKRHGGELEIRHVYRGPYVAFKGRRRKSGRSSVQNPSVFAVIPAEAVLAPGRSRGGRMPACRFRGNARGRLDEWRRSNRFPIRARPLDRCSRADND